jgi:hypothetical protein
MKNIKTIAMDVVGLLTDGVSGGDPTVRNGSTSRVWTSRASRWSLRVDAVLREKQ